MIPQFRRFRTHVQDDVAQLRHLRNHPGPIEESDTRLSVSYLSTELRPTLN